MSVSHLSCHFTVTLLLSISRSGLTPQWYETINQSMTLMYPIFSSSGVQDNPWFCDCKISKLIELSKMADTPVVLMDLFLTCSGPENLAGVLFQRAELDNCVKPTVMTSATKITSSLGSNVLLRCDATGLPTPTLVWAKTDGSPINNTGMTWRL